MEKKEEKKSKFEQKQQRSKFDEVVLSDDLLKSLEENAAILIAEKIPKFLLGQQDGKTLYVVTEEPLNEKEDLHLLGYVRCQDHDFLIAWSSANSVAA